MNREHLGTPSIRLGGLQIWVHSRGTSIPPVPYEDEDWLSVTAHCGGAGADVWVYGSILTLSAIKTWAEDCEKINRSLSGGAVLDGIEPELFVTMGVSDRLGHILETHPESLPGNCALQFRLAERQN
jgi:hypothetical protein